MPARILPPAAAAAASGCLRCGFATDNLLAVQVMVWYMAGALRLYSRTSSLTCADMDNAILVRVSVERPVVHIICLGNLVSVGSVPFRSNHLYGASPSANMFGLKNNYGVDFVAYGSGMDNAA